MRAVLAACVVLLFLPAAANATTEHASSGNLDATLTYVRRADVGYRIQLTVRVGGVTVYDRPVVGLGCGDHCFPENFGGHRALRLANLTGSKEPEVVVGLYSGGAHCCIELQVLERSGAGPDLLRRSFGNASVSIVDLDRDGQAELKTQDDRFAYRFTSYAGSWLPVQVLSLDGTRFVDRTRSHPRLLRREAATTWRRYLRYRGHDHDVRGVFAAWAADTVRLGHTGAAKRALDQGVRHRWLGPAARSYAARLWRFLDRIGYR
jgi:hypothetical protein